MKSLQNYSNLRFIVESKGMLDYNFEVFPYEWEKFKKIVLQNKKFKHLVHPDNTEVEFLYEPKSRDILIRYEKSDLKAWTSVEKADFFRSIRGEKNVLDKYLK